MSRLLRWLLIIGAVGVIMGTGLTVFAKMQTGSSGHRSQANAAGCSTVRTTATAVAPTFTAQGRGTIGEAEMLAPLQTAVDGFNRAAAEATSSFLRKDFHDVASDYAQLRTDLMTAHSFSDAAIVADFKNVSDDTAILQTDCP